MSKWLMINEVSLAIWIRKVDLCDNWDMSDIMWLETRG